MKHSARSATSPTPDISPSGGAALLLVSILTIMVGCIIVPGLPGIAHGLGIEGGAGWLVTLPSLGVVLFGPLAGLLIDHMGAYKALCTGLIAYAVVGASVVLLRGPYWVFGNRILLGGVTALVMAGGTSLISEFYQGTARMAMIARQGMAIELGGVVFLAVGGMLTTFGWQAPFALYAMALVFLAMVLAYVPSQGPSPLHTQASAAHRQEGLMWPVRLAALCSMMVFFTAIIVLPFRLSHAAPDGLGFSEAQTGYFLSFVSLVAVGAAALMPAIARARGENKTMMLAFACYEVAQLCFAFASGLALYIPGAVLLGCGFGLSVPLVNHMTIERSDSRSRGRNLAYLSMAIFLGQFLASPLEFVPGGTQASFLTAAAVAFCAVLAGLRPGSKAH